MDTKVKIGDMIIATITENDVRAGQQYLVTDLSSSPSGTVWVKDAVGDSYPLYASEYEAVVALPETSASVITSDGSSTDYYKLPADGDDLLDLIEHKRMSFGVGNIFKACYRLGEKSGTDAAYDLRKMIFFATRELARIEKATA